jgi:ATP/maltotriose-dependent transcriptional regulator MalT
MSAPLTLLVAPAGSGKTVLLTQWAASRPDRHFLLLQVGTADDDPAQFLRRLLSGLATLAPHALELGPLLTIGDRGFGRPLLDSLVVLLGEVPGTVLIFDDLHNLSNRAIIDDLWWLADHLPRDVHLVFSSRSDLRLAWSRHRLRYSLLELRQSELAFDDRVAGEVLHRIAGAAATHATVASIMESTEGWAAGVQLSAIGLRNHDDPEQFARSLAGTDRFISDYLSEEVLSAQTEERRELLLRLSALDEMSPELVEAALGVRDGAELFDELVRDSMFVVPVDGRQESFRFHHLFRDLLRYRLRARHPGDEARVLVAAADWYAARGELGAAIECHLRARSWDRAMDLMFSHGREVFERGYAVSIARWLAIVPEQNRLARPLVETMYGYTLAITGAGAHSEDVLRRQAARADLDAGHLVLVHVFLAALVQFRPQLSVSVAATRKAVRMLRNNADAPIPQILGMTHSTLVWTMALGSRGRAHFLAGELREARRWLTRTLDSPGTRYSPYRIHALGSMALLEAWSGRLDAAEALADEGLGLAREVGLLVHPAPADAYLAKALVAIHRGQPQGSGLALHEGGVRAASNQRTQLMWVARLESVLADDTLETVSAEPLGPPPPIVQRSLDAAGLRVKRLAKRAGAHPTPQGDWSPLLVEGISCALTMRRTADARAMLAAASFAPRDDLPIATVEHDVLSAWLAHQEGRAAESATRLAAALDLAGDHGLVSVFLWAGPEVIALVEALPVSRDGFRERVLARAHERFRPAGDDLAEPLTDRERELLAYLPTRLTNAELAAQFYVSVNTIKTHMAHIYRKLDAANRSAAVARAAELGLL